MGLKIYINGQILPQEDAKISVFDHGLLYGDGVFEGIRLIMGKYSHWRNIWIDCTILQRLYH